MIFEKQRKIVAKYMRRLYKKGLTTCSGGNISMRDENGNFYITASQTDKGNLVAKDIAVFDEHFQLLTPDLKPSMEYNMHFEIYKNRTDVNAIVHAHPVYTSIFAVSDKQFVSEITGEARYILGDVVNIDYQLMGTNELAQESAKSLHSQNVAIMKNHGAICLGENIFQAYDRMEVLEFSAKIFYKTLLIDGCNKLNSKQIDEIDSLKSK